MLKPNGSSAVVVSSRDVASSCKDFRVQQATRITKSLVPTFGGLFDPQLKGLHDDWGNLGTATIDLAVLPAVLAISMRRRLVPLSLGNDVAQLVVRQAHQQPLAPRHQPGDRRLQRGIREIDVRINRLLKLP